MAKFYRLSPNYSNRSISRHQMERHGRIKGNTNDGGEPPMDDDYATKGELRQLSNQVDQRFSEVDQRFLAVDRRFDEVDRKFEAVNRRFDEIDRRFDQLDDRLKEMNTNMGIRFNTLSKLIWWQIGLFTTLVILPAFIAFMRFVLTYHP